MFFLRLYIGQHCLERFSDIRQLLLLLKKRNKNIKCNIAFIKIYSRKNAHSFLHNFFLQLWHVLLQLPLHIALLFTMTIFQVFKTLHECLSYLNESLNALHLNNSLLLHAIQYFLEPFLKKYRTICKPGNGVTNVMSGFGSLNLLFFIHQGLTGLWAIWDLDAAWQTLGTLWARNLLAFAYRRIFSRNLPGV